METNSNTTQAHNTQMKIVFNYLQLHTVTASMVSDATGVPQKCITRYKRYFQKQGLLCEVFKKQCSLTGFKAWFITTNPDLFPKRIQLELFDIKEQI